MDFSLANFDGVIFLTFSNWKTEMRSNRYHYAVRFAKQLPVYFVQVTSKTKEFTVTKVEHGITLVEIPADYTNYTFKKLSNYLYTENIKQPIFWVYNPYFSPFLKAAEKHLVIYHATEDYFCKDFVRDKILKFNVIDTLEKSDIIFTVSQGISDNILRFTNVDSKKIVTIGNGCDLNFWLPPEKTIRERNTVVYQGGIHSKIDFNLLDRVTNIQELKFIFCGEEVNTPRIWNKIKAKKNVTYLGKLDVEDVREICHSSSIGIIPFVQNDWITKRSFPLKAFEYISSGLKVVSVPIDSIIHEPIFSFAKDSTEFINKLKKLSTQTDNDLSLEQIKSICSPHTYDHKFNTVLEKMQQAIKLKGKEKMNVPRKIGIIFDQPSCRVETILEHLEAFQKYSQHQIDFLPLTNELVNFKDDLDLHYDVIVVHYSIRVFAYSHFPKKLQSLLNQFSGLKILFIQDEYDEIPTVRKNLLAAEFDVIYTCVPKKYLNVVYPKSLFKNVIFIENLTGYISEKMASYLKSNRVEKTVDVFYRGRKLPISYGSLGIDKYLIGERFKQLAKKYTELVCDIETDDSKRVYGSAWYERLASAKATLASASGSNVFDFDGTLKAKISDYIARHPNFKDEDIYNDVVKQFDNQIIMNQISPKFLEAMCFKTVLILFRDEYGYDLKEDVHFIGLEKDFSNFDYVIKKISDSNLVNEIANNCTRDFVESGILSYKMFIERFDKNIFDLIVNFPIGIEKTISTASFDVRKMPFYGERETPIIESAGARFSFRSLLHIRLVPTHFLINLLRKLSVTYGRLTKREPTYLYNKVRSYFRKRLF